MSFRKDLNENAEDIYGIGWYEDWLTVDSDGHDYKLEENDGITEWKWEEAHFDNSDYEYDDIDEEDDWNEEDNDNEDEEKYWDDEEDDWKDEDEDEDDEDDDWED